MKTYILINRENHLFLYFITNLFCELLNFSEQCCIQDKLEMLNATNNLFRWKHQRYYAYREFVILGHVSFLCYVFFALFVLCLVYPTLNSTFLIVPSVFYGVYLRQYNVILLYNKWFFMWRVSLNNRHHSVLYVMIKGKMENKNKIMHKCIYYLVTAYT